MTITNEGLAGQIELLIVLEVFYRHNRERAQHILIHYILFQLT